MSRLKWVVLRIQLTFVDPEKEDAYQEGLQVAEEAQIYK